MPAFSCHDGIGQLIETPPPPEPPPTAELFQTVSILPPEVWSVVPPTAVA